MVTFDKFIEESNQRRLEFEKMANDTRIRIMEISMHYLLMENRKNKIKERI